MAQAKQSKQSKQVYSVEYLTLMDGTELEVKPLPIKRLRKAQGLIKDALAGKPVFDDDDEPVIGSDGEQVHEVDDDDLIDALIDTTLMVMQGQESCEKFLEPEEGRELLEDSVDQETLYEIIRVSTGYDFLAMQKRMMALAEREATL